MSKTALIAWLLAAVFAVVAIVAAVAHPTHWKRTIAVAIVLAVVSAGVAATRRRAQVA